MNSLLLYLVMILFKFLPESRLFNLKNMLLRCCGLKIGKGTRICSSVIFNSPFIEIGNHVWIGPGCRFVIASNSTVFIRDNVDIAMENLFVTGSHSIGDCNRRAGSAIRDNITIEKGVWIGARCVIMGGTHIGKSSILAALSFCSQHFPDNQLIVGQPAKIKRSLVNS